MSRVLKGASPMQSLGKARMKMSQLETQSLTVPWGMFSKVHDPSV